MIVNMPKFRIGQKVYCHCDHVTFLTTIQDFYIVNDGWYYNIDGTNFNNKETLQCPECVLSKRINDNKVKIGKYVE